MNKLKQAWWSIITFLISAFMFATAVFMPSFAALADDIETISSVGVFNGSSTEQFQTAVITSDGGYIAVGYSQSTDGDMSGISRGERDAIIVKYSANSNIQWKAAFGGSGHDVFYSVDIINDGYIAVGYSDSADVDMSGISRGGRDAVAVKYDLSGNVVWKKIIGGTSNDYFWGVYSTNDGGFVASGDSSSTNGDFTGISNGGIIVKFDAEGNVQWKSSISGASLYSVKQTKDNGYITSGYKTVYGMSDVLIAKFSSSGENEWSRTMAGPNATERFRRVSEFADGSFVVVGYGSGMSTTGDYSWYTPGNGMDALIMKLSSDGNIIWQKSLSGNQSDYYEDVYVQNDGSILVAGYSESSNSIMTGVKRKGNMDALLVKYDADGNVISVFTYGGSQYDHAYGISANANTILLAGDSYSSDKNLLGYNSGEKAAAYKISNNLVNKDALSTLIEIALNADENSYTPKSWSNFVYARNTAISVLENPNARTEDINAVYNALWAAYNALVLRADKTALESAINQAAGLKQSYYTNASWIKMTRALNNAYSMYTWDGASQSAVDEACENLVAAINALQPLLNKEVLGLSIKTALNLSSSDYSSESWNLMVEKLQTAVAIYNELPGEKISHTTEVSAPYDINQDVIDNANTELLKSIVALVGNKRAIIESITDIAQNVDNSQFTQSSWVLFSNALSRAIDISSDPDATDEEIDVQLEQLKNALSGIESAVIMPPYPDAYIIDSEYDEAYIYGTVDAAIVSAEATLSSYFHIAPNAPEGERFISPDLTILNTSTMPINVSAVSFKATGEAPKVVQDDKYSDVGWAQLGVSETKANIAIGFTGAKTGDFFFEAEADQAERSLGELDAQEIMVLNLQSKFGLSWDKPYTFKYDSVFGLALRG